MSYRIRFTLPDGRTGLWNHDYLTREAAQRAIDDRLTDTGFTYTVEEAPGISAAAVPDAPPSTGVMPRRVWEEQRIRALGEAIARRMGREEPAVASVFDLAHIRDWAAEIVDLCERCGGQQAKPKDAEAPSVPVGASEAPMEGGDSDRRRLEVLERFLDGKQSASIAWWEGEFSAVHVSDAVEITAPTLAALADKLAEMDGKP